MDVTEHLARAGGIAARRELEQATSRAALEKAVQSGRVLRVARGRYALRTASEGQQAAQRLTGTAVLLSAAAHWGWRTKWQPVLPQVAVGRGRKVSEAVRREVDVRWRSIPVDQVADGWVTTRVRTVHDCCALLPFDEALAVVDSALREGRVTRRDLLALDHVPGRLRRRVASVVMAGDARAANPFESVLRAIAVGVPGLEVRPQVRIDDAEGWIGRVDLADVALRIVLEADSHEFHTDADAFARDCWRYDRLAVDDWLVLRFPWLHVMLRQEAVRRLLVRAVDLRSARCRAA